MNSISITGRLTKDAEKKRVGDSDLASFSIAMDAYVKGEKVAMFFDCGVWGKRADTAAQYLKKGGTITVIGKLLPVHVSDQGKAFLKVEVQDFTLPPKGQADSAPAAKVANDEDIPF